jgi:hypothetical protein
MGAEGALVEALVVRGVEPGVIAHAGDSPWWLGHPLVGQFAGAML